MMYQKECSKQESEAIEGKVQQSVSAPMSSLRPCCACGVWNLILGWLALLYTAETAVKCVAAVKDENVCVSNKFRITYFSNSTV